VRGFGGTGCKVGTSLLCLGCLILGAELAWSAEFDWTLVAQASSPYGFGGIMLLDEDTIVITAKHRAGLLDIDSWQIEWIEMPGRFRWPNVAHGPEGLWVSVSTGEEGLPPIWRLSDEGWSSYYPIDYTGFGIPSAHQLWVDQKGHVWANIDLSVQMFDGRTWQGLTGDPYDTFVVVCQAIGLGPDGNVWVGSQYGVFAWSHDGYLADFYAPGNTGGLPFSGMHAIFRDSRDIYWLCGHKALLVFWDGQWFPLYGYIADVAETTTCIDEDECGNMWVGTKGQGIIFISAEDGSFSHLPAPAGDDAGMVFDVISAPDGLIYVVMPNALYAITRS